MPSSSSYTLAVIDKFTGSDLSAADVEYAAWKAKHQRKHIHKHASKHSKHQAASFESASPDEILDFVESLSLSEIDHMYNTCDSGFAKLKKIAMLI